MKRLKPVNVNAPKNPLMDGEKLRKLRGRSKYHEQVIDAFKDPNWISDQLQEMEKVQTEKIWDEMCFRINAIKPNRPTLFARFGTWISSMFRR